MSENLHHMRLAPKRMGIWECLRRRITKRNFDAGSASDRLRVAVFPETGGGVAFSEHPFRIAFVVELLTRDCCARAYYRLMRLFNLLHINAKSKLQVSNSNRVKRARQM